MDKETDPNAVFIFTEDETDDEIKLSPSDIRTTGDFQLVIKDVKSISLDSDPYNECHPTVTYITTILKHPYKGKTLTLNLYSTYGDQDKGVIVFYEKEVKIYLSVPASAVRLLLDSRGNAFEKHNGILCEAQVEFEKYEDEDLPARRKILGYYIGGPKYFTPPVEPKKKSIPMIAYLHIAWIFVSVTLVIYAVLVKYDLVTNLFL